jgi:outer membrane protein OmpA-like peptidoglycan-associated protein
MMRAILVVAVVVAAACGGTRPKPPELDTLQALRKTREAQASAKQSPDLINEADILERRSKSAWQEGELENSRRDALLGWIKLKMAIAAYEETQAKERILAAESEKARSDKELARITKDLTAVQEQIALLDKLSKAKSSAEVEKLKAEQEKQKLAAELALQQQRGETQTKISAAELALKTADTVEAKTYAKAEYQAAIDLLARAQTELNDGNVAAASTSADLAKQKAEAAIATAKPEYMKATESKDSKARHEALGRDAAGLSGITVKLDKKGDVTRLILTYGGAFKPKQSQITAGKEPVLDGVAELLKKYPTYPVQVVGYTDNKGRGDANLVLSNARAQTVYNALVTRGVEAKRFVVSGVGSAQPIGDNKTAKGRDQNNRVELIFLYQ